MKNELLAMLAAALLSGPTVGQAAIVTYDFSVTATSGGLTGATGSGSFSFDDSIVPPGGGLASSVNVFETFQFAWHAVTYNKTSIGNRANLYFTVDGTLDHFVFGPSCTFNLDGQASCILNLSLPIDDWIVTDQAFLYAYKDVQCQDLICTPVNGSGSGRTSFQLQATPVPEPGTLALCSVALLGLGSWCGRQRGVVATRVPC